MNSKKALAIIFCTVFLDLIGFGMILPLNPFLARHFGASAFEVGVLSSIYSISQFLFSPFWGRLSDRWGRRPIILICLLGVSLSYLFFAWANQLWLLFLSRALAGFFGASISTASAYIADVTSRENRSKNMGLIGAAFGIGFIVGPVFGGVLGEIGLRLGLPERAAMSLPAYGAFILCFLNFLAAIRFLHESLPLEKRSGIVRKPRWDTMIIQLRRPIVGELLILTFATIFAMALMEAMLFLFVADKFGFSQVQASYAFGYVGVMIAFTQGYLIRKLLPRFGENRLLLAGSVFMGIGLGLIGLSHSVSMLACAVTVLALGSGFTSPSILGCLSLLSKGDEQGEVLGVNQSLSALGRIFGPMCGGWLFAHFGVPTPFLAGSAVAFLASGLVFIHFKKFPASAKA